MVMKKAYELKAEHLKKEFVKRILNPFTAIQKKMRFQRLLR